MQAGSTPFSGWEGEHDNDNEHEEERPNEADESHRENAQTVDTGALEQEASVDNSADGKMGAGLEDGQEKCQVAGFEGG